LAGENRPDALVLLEKVREARAAAEEDSFYKRGREKAVKLIQDEQWDQAAELLRNLLALFPGDPILERDLKTAEANFGKRRQNVETSKPEPVVAAVVTATAAAAAHALAPAPTAPPAESSYKRLFEPDVAALAPEPRPMLAGILPMPVGPLPLIGVAVALLASTGVGIRMLTRRNTPPPAPPARVAPAPVQIPVQPVIQPASQQQQGEVLPASPSPSSNPAAPPADSPAEPSTRRDSRNRQEQPRRVFDPSTLTASANNQPQATAALPPAGAVQSPIGGAEVDSRLLGAPTAPLPPAPPPAATPQPAPQNNPPAQQAKPAAGGNFAPAVRVSGIAPRLPAFAQQLSIRKGSVTLMVTIDSRGVVRNVSPVDGHPVLAAAAKDAVLSWKYKPATLDGKPIESKVEIHVLFQDK